MKKIYILIPVFLLLMGCSPKITEEYLSHGYWILKDSYDSKNRGEPSCIPLQKGVEFKENGIVYVNFFERDLEYRLDNKVSRILFRDTGPDLDPKAIPDYGVDYFNYDINLLGNDEMVLIGRGLLEGYNCYLERKSN